MIDLSEAELRAALKSESEYERFTAAFVVGDRRLSWPADLIPMLDDPNDWVRQAARRTLVILSFLELNPEEAALIASPRPNRPPTPLSKLTKPVDFGPALGASKTVRKSAMTKWTDWWADRDPAATKPGRSSTARLKSQSGRSDLSDSKAAELADALVRAAPARRKELVAQYRETKGVRYTEALADAIARSNAADRPELRDALARRMVRMTDDTLRTYLDDPLPEIRRAAALGLAKQKNKAHADRLADLLVDPDPLVGRAAHDALCQLSGKDFGPGIDAGEADRAEAVARWKAWGQAKK
jgi:HEAT repeat protein